MSKALEMLRQEQSRHAAEAEKAATQAAEFEANAAAWRDAQAEAQVAVDDYAQAIAKLEAPAAEEPVVIHSITDLAPCVTVDTQPNGADHSEQAAA